jgi:kynurenine formamidase
MNKFRNLVAFALVLAVSLTLSSAAFADLKDSEWNSNWWKNNPWGKDDKAGSVNMVNPCNTLKVMKLVKTGRSATLGKLYMDDYIFFGPRFWKMTIPGTPTGGPFGKNNLVYHDEWVTTQIGQVSTQFDGPGHIGVRTPNGDFMYNGRDRDKVYERGAGGQVKGMGDAGVEHVAKIGFICRGVLIDAAGYKNMKALPIPMTESSPGVVTESDIKGAVKKQGIADIGPGDCVFIYTGHGDLALNDEWPKLSPEERAKRRAISTSGEPGFGHSACSYFAKVPIMMTGGDTSANDAQPSDHGYAVPCHTMLMTQHGIWNLENLEFTQLLKDKVYEFAFIWAPLKILGGTGSPGNPLALY